MGWKEWLLRPFALNVCVGARSNGEKLIPCPFLVVVDSGLGNRWLISLVRGFLFWGWPLRGAGFCVIGWCSFAAGACCKVAAGVGSSGVGSWLFCGSLCCRCRPFFFRRGRLEGAPPWGVVGPRARGNWCAFAKKKKVASLEKWNSRKTTLVCNFYSFARGQYQELL